MNDIKQLKSILNQGISRHINILLDCEFQEKLLNVIKVYENVKDQLQQKENKEKEIREYIEENDNKEPWKSLNGKELLEILDKEVN